MCDMWLYYINKTLHAGCTYTYIRLVVVALEKILSLSSFSINRKITHHNHKSFQRSAVVAIRVCGSLLSNNPFVLLLRVFANAIVRNFNCISSEITMLLVPAVS